MRKSITFFLLAFLLGAPCALAQGELKLQEGAPERYVVQKGDTLWGIAEKFLKDPWRWPQIWRLNQEQIADPHRIYPGNVIILHRAEAPPQLTLQQDTVKLSPQVRESPLPVEAIPSIPPNAIEPFLSQPLVIEQDGLVKAPRIVGTQENRVHLAAGNLAYVSGIGGSKEINWQVFRPGRALVDPESNQTLGYEAVHLGTGRVTRDGEPATLQIVVSKQEISAGDRLLPTGPVVLPQYVPHAPKVSIQGRVIALFGGLATGEGGTNSIISINKGRRDGLENGHVLAIYRTGATIPDPESPLSRDSAPKIRLPDERYGLVFVFRIFDAVSYALVMNSSRPVAPGDHLRTP